MPIHVGAEIRKMDDEEFKAVQSLTESHRRQVLQYLFLTELPHGKLVNLRAERVQHEFVNNALTRPHRSRRRPMD